jgi:hypothetical protein
MELQIGSAAIQNTKQSALKFYGPYKDKQETKFEGLWKCLRENRRGAFTMAVTGYGDSCVI